MAAPARDTLWLGLHKTGTTFLQKSLDLSRPALLAAGIDWPGLEPFRTLYTRPLLHPGWPDPPGPPGPGRLPRRLVFDENILGLVHEALDPGGPYPAAAPRARLVADHLGLARPRLVLGLRGFATFLPSLYCEALKAVPFLPFRAFLRTPPEALSWEDLVDRLRAAFPGSELLLYAHEALAGNERRLLAAVTGLPEAAFTLLEGRERPGFSGRAVAEMHALAEIREVRREDVRGLNRKFPRDPGVPGFEPWSEPERAGLEARYAAQLAGLRARPDLTVLDLAAPR